MKVLYMRFISDFHIHSCYSRATAKNLNLENLHIAAQLKGISVVGTGDFTHPQWFSELKEKLVYDERGLLRLKPEIAKQCDKKVPPSCRSQVAFMLVTEISSIYKKKGKTRKNHNLLFVPDLDTALKLGSKLSTIGNIKSDGRPILGLDAKDLLEILLETTDRGLFVPAHIWTPWFSVLGSKSGFNSIRECFEDLTPYIHAVETGLSSDPLMNWRVSDLENLTLISNSDAHSPANLGREASIFDTELKYDAIISAMKSGDPNHFLGTLEFYPEEGKYHYDGHRKCDIRFHPQQTLSHNNICPVCEKPLTLGVLYRVNELSDRPEGMKPKKNHPYHHIIPLTDILSEMLRVGPRTKKVMEQYQVIVEKLGPELNLLQGLSLEKIEEACIPLLKESISRMRKNQVHIDPGYDGEFGRVKIFKDGERETLLSQKTFFHFPSKNDNLKKINSLNYKRLEFNKKVAEKKEIYFSDDCTKSKELPIRLNSEQKKAVEFSGSAILILAGPGTGKTKTITHRISHLINKKKLLAENIIAVTFTNKAAQEMKNRLMILLEGKNRIPFIGTFHSLCFNILKEINPDNCFSILNEEDRIYFVREAIKQLKKLGTRNSLMPEKLLRMIVNAKQEILKPDSNFIPEVNEKEFVKAYEIYQKLLHINRYYDFDDLLVEVVTLFESDPFMLNQYRNRFRYIFIDEYQDLNPAQYRLIRNLAPGDTGLNQVDGSICVIGDPDQSIYGFRGSDVSFFQRFLTDYKGAEMICLTRNYRCTETILNASYQIIRDHRIGFSAPKIYSGILGIPTISVIETSSDISESETIAHIIQKLVGGVDFLDIDSGIANGNGSKDDRGFSDIAVLYRTRQQGKKLAEIFEKRGIPFQLVEKENIFGKKGISELISIFRLINGCATYPDLERSMETLAQNLLKSDIRKILQWIQRNRFQIFEIQRDLKIPESVLKNDKQLFFQQFIENLEKIGSETKNLSEQFTIKMQLTRLAEQTGLRKVIDQKASTCEAFNKVLDFSEQFDKNMREFLDAVALQTDMDSYSFRAEKVFLMTMHSAKGLEFPIVFIAGCEDGLIPYRQTFELNEDIQEERRLFYVAMTRAKESLYLVWARKRQICGKLQERILSPFVNDIENQLKKHEKSIKKNETQRGQIQLQMFQ